ncbi:MAG: Rpn family recombination-promoting nuclease/putative transposase [Culicoidibacterales bacterium]
MNKKYQPHDKGFKLLLKQKDIFMSFLREFAHGEFANIINEDSLELEESTFLTQNIDSRESDILYKAKFGEREIYFYILLEMQSKPDNTMPFRLLEYQLEIWRRYHKDHFADSQKNYKLPIIQPIILYNGKRKWHVPQQFHGILDGIDDYPAKEYVLNFHYDLVDVNRFKSTDLKEHTSLISRVFLVEKSDDIDVLFQDLQYNAEHVFKTENDITTFKSWLQYSAGENYQGNIKDWINQLELGGVTMIKSNINYLLEKDEKKKKQIAIDAHQLGLVEGKLEVAQKMLALMDDQTIAKITGLAIADIAALRLKR